MTDAHALAVARGAGLLDRVAVATGSRVVRPDWRDQLDLTDLDVASIRRCVVGQTLGVTGHTAMVRVERLVGDPDAGLGWHEALDLLGAPAGVGDWSSPARDDWTVEHGFEARTAFEREQLTDAWRRYVVATRASTFA